MITAAWVDWSRKFAANRFVLKITRCKTVGFVCRGPGNCSDKSSDASSLPTSDTLQRFQINSSMGWWSMWQPPTTRASLLSTCMPVDFAWEAGSRFRLPYIKPGPLASLICKTNWKVPSPRLAHLEGRICNSTNHKVVPPNDISRFIKPISYRSY